MYFKRAIYLLYKSYSRDKSKSEFVSTKLSKLEEYVLKLVITVFIKGLINNNLRLTIINRLIISCGLLRGSYNILLKIS